MEIRLGTVKNVEKETFIDFGDELTKEQYQNFLDSISEINELENNKRLFEITFLNKNDFVDTFNRDVKDMISSSWTLGGDRKKYYDHHLNFNRLFLNYLSSIRTFIDHNETYIKRKYGKKSREVLEFEKMTNYYFDNFFCYRFFYKLRNYSQHCGLPLRDFNLSTNRNLDNSYYASAEMTFDSNDLLNTYKEWGPIVKTDLEKINGKFPLAPLIENMTKVLIGFLQSVDSLNSNRVYKAAKFIKNSTKHLRTAETDVCIFTNIRDSEDGTLKNFDRLTIPLDIVDLLDTSGC